MFVAGPHNRMTTRWNDLYLQTNAAELLYDPICTFLQFFFVLIIS